MLETQTVLDATLNENRKAVPQQSPRSRSAPWVGVRFELHSPKGFHNRMACLWNPVGVQVAVMPITQRALRDAGLCCSTPLALLASVSGVIRIQTKVPDTF